ncbi:tRNA lysidine(34) synthetase TilS [Algoriphagus machipongonensis]|uniref:tRNA(Ile)-lysidine synthase n=1 Tax=Algoriphagus machipongonensis TaxID=388413 RepID=A3HXB1_9BACT|nr:tRNA lysidine(34) synthetase TilS [Algoriphagus machipongonensis]EAZ81234.1 tRNA(Ile)-lysidine synthase [Algoriphagus machipongonensis]
MIEAFIHHIKNKSILDLDKKYLLACSGGLDSVCLGTLLHQSGFSFEVAHVNFHLREKESDGDELFVKNLAEQWNAPFHVHQADTYSFVEDHKVSTQMAARDIRYEWFEQIRKERNLAGILLAHHEDDQLETIFLNLLRGTGIEGLYGMAEKRGKLIRPLLPFSRAEILEFATAMELAWREDSSNKSTDYKRNKLRIDILPKLLDFAEDSRANLFTSFDRLKDTGRAFTGLFDQWKSQAIKDEEGIQTLGYSDFLHLDGATSLIYFWLRSYGFNSTQAQEIYQSCLLGESGKLFESASFVLNNDRDQLILAPKSIGFADIELSSNDLGFDIPEGKYELLKTGSPSEIDKSPSNAMLDLEQLTFPLKIRQWEEGDRFIPLGMKNSKKISDFLIDLKVPLVKKSGIKVLESDGKIAWIIGYRIADWAKQTAATRKTLYLKKR